jgi:hypothetical protein
MMKLVCLPTKQCVTLLITSCRTHDETLSILNMLDRHLIIYTYGKAEHLFMHFVGSHTYYNWH